MLSPTQSTTLLKSDFADFIGMVSPVKGIVTPKTQWTDDALLLDLYSEEGFRSPLACNNSFSTLPNSSTILNFGTPTFQQYNGSPCRRLFDQAHSPHQDLSNFPSISPKPSKLKSTQSTIPSAFRSVYSYRMQIDDLPGCFQQQASRVNRVLFVLVFFFAFCYFVVMMRKVYYFYPLLIKISDFLLNYEQEPHRNRFF